MPLTTPSQFLNALLTGLVVLSTAGCQEPYSDQIPIYWGRSAPEEPAFVDAIEDAFGMEVVETSDPYGAVSVYLYQEAQDGIVLGESAGFMPCGSSLWSTMEPQTLAHEIGHSLGLEHVDDDANLMHPELGPGRFELNDEQLETARISAGWWSQCDRDSRRSRNGRWDRQAG